MQMGPSGIVPGWHADEGHIGRPAVPQGHHHRTWLETRLAYRIQERAFGGLKPSVRRRLEEIGKNGLLPKGLQRDADRLLPDVVLTRVFDGVEHRTRVVACATSSTRACAL